jgi:hypothetical protein
LLFNQIQERNKENLYQRERNIHVHEIKTSSCERDGRWEKKMREKKRKKYADHVRENGETKLVNEYYASKFVSIFTHQNFLIKVIRLLRVIF